MWSPGYFSKASVWDCIMLSMERFHCPCVCSAKNILASEKRKHTMRDSQKQDWKQPAQFHTANFLADVQLLLLFFLQAHLSVWCHQIQRGREPEQIGLTTSYSLPASRHMLLLYKGCLETKHALRIHRLYPLLKALQRSAWGGRGNEFKTSVLANPSALYFS